MKQCPKCTKIVEDNSRPCECGYEFGESEIVSIPQSSLPASPTPGYLSHTVLYLVTWFFALLVVDPDLGVWRAVWRFPRNIFWSLSVAWKFPMGLFAFVFPATRYGDDDPGWIYWPGYCIYLVHGFLYLRFRRAGPTVLLYCILVLLLFCNVSGCYHMMLPSPVP